MSNLPPPQLHGHLAFLNSDSSLDPSAHSPHPSNATTTAATTSSSTSSPSATSCDFSEWTPSLTIIPIVYSLIFITGVVGNGLVLWTSSRSLDCRCGGFLRRTSQTRVGGGAGGGTGSTSDARSSRARSLAGDLPPKRVADIYIFSLATADLVFLTTLPLWAASTALNYRWPFGRFLCKASTFVNYVNMHASVFCLTCLSFDRYIAIVHAVPSAGLRTRRHAALSAALVWILALMASLPATLLKTTVARDAAAAVVEFDGYDGSYQHGASPDGPGGMAVVPAYGFEAGVEGGGGVEAATWWSCEMEFPAVEETEKAVWFASVSLSVTLLSFLLPEVVMCFCYVAIARKLSYHFSRVHSEQRVRRQLLWTIATLVLAFTLCWLPFHTVRTIDALRWLQWIPDICALDQLLNISNPYVLCLGYLNSCLNPFLYAFCDAAFRAQCRRLLLGSPVIKKILRRGGGGRGGGGGGGGGGGRGGGETEMEDDGNLTGGVENSRSEVVSMSTVI